MASQARDTRPDQTRAMNPVQLMQYHAYAHLCDSCGQVNPSWLYGCTCTKCQQRQHHAIYGSLAPRRVLRGA
jgi:hypothetical protein